MSEIIQRILEAVAAMILFEIIKIAVEYITQPKDK